MMNIYNYDAHAEWGGNHKNPKEIAMEFLKMVDKINKIYPIPADCTKSYWSVLDEGNEDDVAPLDKFLDNFERYVEDNICTDENDEPDGGYWIFSGINLEPVSVSERGTFSFDLQDGSPFRNYFEFSIGGYMFPPDMDRVTFPFFKDVLLAGLSIWPADWAKVYCSLWGADPAEACLDPSFPASHFHMPWMCYLSPERAAKVRAPAGVLTEPTPDGGLLLIAAETRLDPQDPEHMKRSKALAELMIEHVGKD